ncbi:uncharacterized protein [Watersipora subatra]|uniref:uncharacterized protein isoform X2 n=1 Tax=Watersipora subatra TaxID=2589382 RepID=UPI00355BF9EF
MRSSSKRKLLFWVLIIAILVTLGYNMGLQGDRSTVSNHPISPIKKSHTSHMTDGRLTIHREVKVKQHDDFGAAMYAIRILHPRPKAEDDKNKGVAENVRFPENLELAEKVASDEKLGSFEKEPEEEHIIVPKDALLLSDEGKGIIPDKLTCQDYQKSRNIKNVWTSPEMTLHLCRNHCFTVNSTFMALMNGDTCLCLNQHGESYVLKESECDVLCSGDNSTLCGGRQKMIIYRIDSLDGEQFWSSWSRTSIAKQREIWTRFRGCSLAFNSSSVCTAELQRDFYQVSEKNLLERFIGCFTSGSFEDLTSTFINSVGNLSNATTSGYNHCVEECARSPPSFYSVIVRHKCLCTISLGWSQTTEACAYGVGALVYSNTPISHNRVTLRFEKRRTEKNVAIIAHYRGGSTLTSAMFSLRKGSLSAFELDKLLGSKWPGVSIMGQEEERSSIFLNKILPAWFSCEAINIPAVFYKVFPKDIRLYFGFKTILTCIYAARHRRMATVCAPFLREKCLMAPIVSVKTVRILHAGTIRKAIADYPTVQFVHALRDPRAMHASRAAFNKFYSEDIVQRLKDSCWELVELYRVLEIGKVPNNTHVIHYEDLATDLISAATNIYRSMNMSLTSDISSALHKMIGEGAERVSNYDVVQEHPKARINGWTWYKKRYGAIGKADDSEECTALFSYYKHYYRPLQSLLEENPHPWKQQ